MPAYVSPMAEASIQLPNRTTRLLADTAATSPAWIAAVPTRTPAELASPRAGGGRHADRIRIAELEAELRAVREQEARSRLILDSATGYAIVTLDAEGCVTSWNAGAHAITGYAEAEILGRSGDVIFTSEDRASGRFAAGLRRAAETGCARNERWRLRRDGTRFWASGTMTPLLDADGRLQGFLNILRDRTAVRAAAERRELLMAEMSHRIKNTFAMVQAVAAKTYRHTGTAAEFQAAFGARLMVLARSNDLLTRTDWHDAPLRDVIESALGAHGGEPGRITVAGPPVLLGADLAVTVSLAFHELATNAVKYGALCGSAGRVDVSWTTGPSREDACKVDIVWRERGGPVVAPPQHRGFGSQLLEKGMPSGGTVKLDFQPEGLECRICLPLSAAPSQEVSS